LKSAVLVVASQAAVVPLSGLATYSATKTFASFVAEALNTEFSNEIDFISYHAAEVDTKMIKDLKNYRTITSSRAAESSLRDLGFA